MDIIDLMNGKKVLVDEGKRITPEVSRITYNEGYYFCKDRHVVRMPYARDNEEVMVTFCVDSLTKDITGTIYNSYFRNVDYVKSIENYDDYLSALDKRVKTDKFHQKRDETTYSRIKHWRYRK